MGKALHLDWFFLCKNCSGPFGYSTQRLTSRCSEPRAGLRSTFCVFAIHFLVAWRVAPRLRSVILCPVRSRTIILGVLIAAFVNVRGAQAR
jgi:hypothetical protein